MNGKSVLLAFASVFLLSAVIGGQLIVDVGALPRIPGVSPGDWVEAVFLYSGNATMPPANQMSEWANITVQAVSGPDVTLERITRYADGHEEIDTCVVDVNTGQGNGTGSFIAANLTAGDLIYTSPPPDLGPFGVPFIGATINETISREYLGQTEEVNHWNGAKINTYPEWTVTQIVDCYWIRATGMIAEISGYRLLQPDVGNTTWMKIEAVRANISEFPVTYGDETYDVPCSSNSEISALEFDPVDNAIRFNVAGPTGTDGFCKIRISHDLMEPPYNVIIDGGQTEVSTYDEYSYDNVTSIHFTYQHSIHEIVIIPEFPTRTSIQLMLFLLTVSIVIYKRRLLKTPIH